MSDLKQHVARSDAVVGDFESPPFIIPGVNEDKIDFGMTIDDLNTLQGIFPSNADIYNLSGLSYPQDKSEVERISITQRDGVYHFTLKLNNGLHTSYDINIHTMEYDKGIIIKAGNDANNYQELIVNRLYYMKKIGIKKVNINACRRHESGQEYYGYNIRPKYGYDVYGDKRGKMLQFFHQLLNTTGLSFEGMYTDEQVKQRLQEFLSHYTHSTQILLMPLLLEDDMLRSMRRRHGFSFDAQMVLDETHPTWQYFQSQFAQQ